MSSLVILHGKKVLVTGATGFIGGRLTEYLALHCGAEVRATVRNHGRAIRIARLPAELISSDLLDFDSLRRAVAGCDVVFHCAVGTSGTLDERIRTTVNGTENMMRAALEHGVKRFVHVSTVAVHGPDPGAYVDEDTPYQYIGQWYTDAKIDAEKIILRYFREHGLPVVILRPAVVYGPYSVPWTIVPVDRLKRGRLTLIEGGTGICNHVYVDDVVQALVLAAVRQEAIGESFVISYGEGVSWADFFGYYAQMLGQDTIPNLTLADISRVRRRARWLKFPLVDAFSYLASPRAKEMFEILPKLNPVFRTTSALVPDRAKEAALAAAERLRAEKLQLPTVPGSNDIKLFRSSCLYRIDKAKQLLGYKPQVSLERGMALTEEWLRYIGMV